MKSTIKYFLLTIIVLWLFGFLYMFFGNSRKNFVEERSDFSNQNDLNNWLLNAEKELLDLQSKNRRNEEIINELRQKAQEYEKKIAGLNSDQAVIFNPSYEFEETRRKIYHDIKDVSFFINSQIGELKNLKETTKLSSHLDFIEKNFQERINLLIASSYNLSISDQLGEWRKSESEKLSHQVQNKFNELQNPSDCKSKKKIICDMGKSCGFGCQMHHVMYCFITAYFTNRTMILQSNGWRYNQKGYEAYFEPLSKTCSNSEESHSSWNDNHNENVKAIKMPIIDAIIDKPDYLPLSVPREFLGAIKKFHGDPFVWWSGQILSFLMRFNSKFQEIVSKHTKDIKFKTPCVGIHVRRTDKIGTEAAFHSIDEYMKYAKDFFDIYDLKNDQKAIRSVYLATDEPKVLQEAKEKYKDYNFLVDETNARTASLDKRYSPESAQGVILDIFHLSQCDYLVCTFSSQVCRMSYELMQVRFPDASWRFKSLDDVYYFGGQNKHDVVAIYDHQPVKEFGEIELKKGDLISLAGNHWNGYSKGKNKRTHQEGLFPTFKTINVIDFY